MTYWPSYSEIAPTSRAAYLDWLTAGRRDPGAYIGYVFLFLYGLERRILLDAQQLPSARADIPAITEEIRALLEVYGSNRSFRSYASNLLDIAPWASGASFSIEELTPPDPQAGYDYPLTLKVALGAMARNGEPVPADWALCWIRSTPGGAGRTPAERCAAEFDELFRIRYHEQFGDGLVLKPNKARLVLNYRPANAGFGGQIGLEGPDVPDVTRLSGPIGRIQKVADDVCSELDSYSRWVGRNDDRSSPAALALLPNVLVKDRLSAEAKEFLAPIHEQIRRQEVAVVSTADLVRYFPSRSDDKLTKKEATMLAEFFAGAGLGIEPDARFGAPNLSRSEYAAVFELSGGDTPPSESYGSATLLLHLGAAVAAADKTVSVEEEQQLEAHLEEALQLSDPDRVRLRAHLRWLLADPPTLRGLKNRLEELPEPTRQDLARFLIAVAGADGHVSPAELKVLAKVYPLLGLSEASLYSDVHALAAGDFAEPGPVSVVAPDPPEGYALPRDAARRSAGISLDMAKITTVKKQSAEAAEVLGRVFAGDEPEEPEPAEVADEHEVAPAVPGILGLDQKHSALVQILVARHHWQRADFNALAGEHGLLPAGAIEIINEAAFETCGEPLLEGSDRLDINPYAVQEIMA
jgi:uncharacterized tellurite resistance protein B-like protein